MCDIVGIRCRDRDGMHQPAARVHTDVAFHPEFPFISLSRFIRQEMRDLQMARANVARLLGYDEKETEKEAQRKEQR